MFFAAHAYVRDQAFFTKAGPHPAVSSRGVVNGQGRNCRAETTLLQHQFTASALLAAAYTRSASRDDAGVCKFRDQYLQPVQQLPGFHAKPNRLS